MAIPSISDADAFHTLRQTAAWTALSTDAAKTAALHRARDYIISTYTFVDGTLDTDEVVETAIIMLAAEKTSDTALTQSAAVLELEQEADGAGRIRTKYADGTTIDLYPLVTATLRPVLKVASTATSGGVGKMVL